MLLASGEREYCRKEWLSRDAHLHDNQKAAREDERAKEQTHLSSIPSISSLSPVMKHQIACFVACQWIKLSVDNIHLTEPLLCSAAALKTTPSIHKLLGVFSN